MQKCSQKIDNISFHGCCFVNRVQLQPLVFGSGVFNYLCMLGDDGDVSVYQALPGSNIQGKEIKLNAGSTCANSIKQCLDMCRAQLKRISNT